MDWRHMGELLDASEHSYSDLLNLCVWVKDNGGMGSFYRSQHELVFVFRNGQSPHRNNVQLGQFGRYRTNVWNLHPTVKPMAIIADAIMDCSCRQDIVVDPFLGSGTTVIAAERTGRICYGLEIDPVYVDTIVRRWQTLTGQSAVSESSSRTFCQIEKEELANG
jgi:DNA modification methylase